MKVILYTSNKGLKYRWSLLFEVLMFAVWTLRGSEKKAKTANLVSISSTFYVQIFCTNVVFLHTCNLKKAAETMFVRKTRAYNVDEIDGRRVKIQFYHNLSIKCVILC